MTTPTAARRLKEWWDASDRLFNMSILSVDQAKRQMGIPTNNRSINDMSPQQFDIFMKRLKLQRDVEKLKSEAFAVAQKQYELTKNRFPSCVYHTRLASSL